MEIKELLQSTDVLVRNTAELVQKYTEARDQKLITQTEYVELVNDVLDIGRLEKLCATMEQKAQIHQAVEALKEVASFIPI